MFSSSSSVNTENLLDVICCNTSSSFSKSSGVGLIFSGSSFNNSPSFLPASLEINSASFQSWVEMVDPIVSYIGVESGSMVSHKRFLALFSGGMLPLISLSFLHMLVKFEETGKNNVNYNHVWKYIQHRSV